METLILHFSVMLMLSLMIFCAGTVKGNAGIGKLWKEEHIEAVQKKPSLKLSNPVGHEKCHANLPACLSCIDECGSQAQNTSREKLINFSIALEACERKMSKLRSTLPTWCLVDGTGFSSKPGYVPQSEVCEKIDIQKCFRHWMMEDKDVITFEVRRLASEYASLYGSVQHDIADIKRFPDLLDNYKTEKEKKLLEQANIHLKQLDGNTTIYADPVYYGIYELSSENDNLEILISRTDVYSAGIENRFVRRETIDKVPSLLSSILELKNHIHSKKEETEVFLADIKMIARKITKFQGEAASLMYETTHLQDADGEISLLDRELFSLYVELKKERAVLNRANLKAAFTKMRLVGALRRLVWEISRSQAKGGCRPEELMTFTESSSTSR